MLLIVALLAGGIVQTAMAQSSDAVYITETGHWIYGDFLRIYNSVNDPLLFFGFPLTDEFVDPDTGQKVQYFQRARFEMVETPDGLEARLAPLGTFLHQEGTLVADIPNEGPTCRRFDSGFSVCYAFLQFYDAYNGKTWFGQPISEVEVADGRYVQYFENVRMEWWPEKPAGEKVTLSDLGRVYFDKEVADAELLKPSVPASSDQKKVEASIKVFARHSLIGAGEQQTVFVIVQDQYFRPIQDAAVGVTVILPDGNKSFYRLSTTNEFGISQISFTVDALEVRSVVNISAEAEVLGEKTTGKSWFRIWW